MPPAAAARAGPSPPRKLQPRLRPLATTGSAQHEQESNSSSGSTLRSCNRSKGLGPACWTGTDLQQALPRRMRSCSRELGMVERRAPARRGHSSRGEGCRLRRTSPGQGSRVAAREPGKQPKALHAEQFPGNGAQVRTWSNASCSLCAATDCHPGPGGVKRADSSELRNAYSSCTTEKSPSRPALADHPPR